MNKENFDNNEVKDVKKESYKTNYWYDDSFGKNEFIDSKDETDKEDFIEQKDNLDDNLDIDVQDVSKFDSRIFEELMEKQREHFQYKIDKLSSKLETVSILKYTIILCILSILIVGGVIIHENAEKFFPQKVTVSYNENTAISEKQEGNVASIAKKYMPAVVKIDGEGIYDKGFFPTKGHFSGTGVVFSIDNDFIYIVTNNHVVEQMKTKPQISFDDNEIVKSEIVGTDKFSDLSVLKVKKSDVSEKFLEILVPVTLANSDNVNVGDKAVAIGNPLGYVDTLTVGYISGVNREIVREENFLNLIQTDAAINSGNSGGALFNMKGELIGINTIKIAQSGVEGLGFAIPSNTVKKIISDLLKHGKALRPYIGIGYTPLRSDYKKDFNLPDGMFISQVEKNSPAYKSGLKRGDIIIKIDNKDVTKMGSISKVVLNKNIGDLIVIKIYRVNEGYKDIEVKLGTR